MEQLEREITVIRGMACSDSLQFAARGQLLDGVGAETVKHVYAFAVSADEVAARECRQILRIGIGHLVRRHG